MSLEGLNRALGGFFRGQLERRSLWRKGFLAFLGLLVVLNLAGIKPHEASGPSHAEKAGHGEESPQAAAPGVGVALNYYPQGAHTYHLTGWVAASSAGRAVIQAFHYVHEAEAFPGFWALFGVLVALVLVRLSKGAAHTFLGKEEDFYD